MSRFGSEVLINQKRILQESEDSAILSLDQARKRPILTAILPESFPASWCERSCCVWIVALEGFRNGNVSCLLQLLQMFGQRTPGKVSSALQICEVGTLTASQNRHYGKSGRLMNDAVELVGKRVITHLESPFSPTRSAVMPMRPRGKEQRSIKIQGSTMRWRRILTRIEFLPTVSLLPIQLQDNGEDPRRLPSRNRLSQSQSLLRQRECEGRFQYPCGQWP